MHPPEYLIVGALTRDVLADGSSLAGGTAWYAAHAAAMWQQLSAIFAPLPPSIISELPSSVAICRVPSSQIATFSNQYRGDQRTQHLRARSNQLDWAALPPPWRQAQIVHLAPLADELRAVPPRSLFPHALIGLTAQGWLRRWDATGRVSPQRWQPTAYELAQIDVVVASEEDLGADQTQIETWIESVPCVALTRGSHGATVWHTQQRYDIPAYPAQVHDPTGAGDVWAAAFFQRLRQGDQAQTAAHWACAAAACAIEGIGVSALPTLAQVQQRLTLTPLA